MSLSLLPSSVQRTQDHHFRARSCMTGKSTAEDDHVFHLFVRAKDPKVEQWEGSRSGTQAALDVFNADEVYTTYLLTQTSS